MVNSLKKRKKMLLNLQRLDLNQKNKCKKFTQQVVIKIAIIMITNNRKHPANDDFDEENINNNNAEQKQ